MVAIIHGTLVHTPIKGELAILHDSLLITDDHGSITFLKQGIAKESVPSILQKAGLSAGDTNVRYLSDYQFLMPGLVDTHIHAPQYPFTGTSTDLPLTEWLNKYTFPSEQKFQDTDWARKVYGALVRRLLRNGTTTAVYFASIHLEATQILADTTVDCGQRALVGLVSMDRNAPDDYVDTTAMAISKAEHFIQYCQQHATSLLTPVVTPRFIPTCTISLLEQLGQLARRYNVPVQSHISESLGEVDFVRQLHPEFESDATLFDACGLLTDRSIMAHGVHLTDSDVHLMASRGSGVAVCPLSNAYFANGVFPVQRFSPLSVKMGLGTDVAGGYSPSMLTSIRQAVISSSFGHDHPGVDWKTALYMATLGGAELVGLGDVIGSFAEAKQLDALVIDLTTDDSPLDLLLETESMDLLVEKFVNLGDDRCIVDVIIAGNYVTPQ